MVCEKDGKCGKKTIKKHTKMLIPQNCSWNSRTKLRCLDDVGSCRVFYPKILTMFIGSLKSKSFSACQYGIPNFLEHFECGYR